MGSWWPTKIRALQYLFLSQMSLQFSNYMTPTGLRGFHPYRIVYFQFYLATVSETKESDVPDHCRQFKLQRKCEHLQRSTPHSFMWYGGLSKASQTLASALDKHCSSYVQFLFSPRRLKLFGKNFSIPRFFFFYKQLCLNFHLL